MLGDYTCNVWSLQVVCGPFSRIKFLEFYHHELPLFIFLSSSVSIELKQFAMERTIMVESDVCFVPERISKGLGGWE